MKKRRSLTHLGGVTETEGEKKQAELLAHALAVTPASDDSNDPSRAHVHGFHTYPARMHPVTAARLIAAVVPNGGRVLDPFCGSGTVLVEALLAGHDAVGVDLNPLAVMLTACKTRPRRRDELQQLIQLAADCATEADERRIAKAGARRRFQRQDVSQFEPHVLLELDSLRGAISTIQDSACRSDLQLVLSALLVKLSRKASDTSRKTKQRRTPGGYAAKLFVEKARELAERLETFTRLLPSKTLHATAVLDDAAILARLPREPIAAVITSPPYAATYDYLSHHELRIRWLGLDSGPLAHGEFGSRSAYSKLKGAAARARWRMELQRFFLAVGRLLPPTAPVVLLMADSAVGETALRVDEIVVEASKACGFTLTARASQARPHFHGPTSRAFHGHARREHLLLLRKA